MNNRQRAKYIAKLYWDLSDGRSEKEVDKIASAIFDFLTKRGQLSLLSAVIDETKKITYDHKNQISVEVLSKYALTTSEQASIKSLIRKKTGKEAILEHKDVQDLLGGVKIKYADKIIDLSVKKQLEKLKEHLLKN